MSEAVQDYGWEGPEHKQSASYLMGAVFALLGRYKARRVLDIGCGNGSLCAELAQRGYDVVGVEYDAKGVEIAKRFHPAIPFFNYGVGSDPQLLLAQEEPFDTVVSTEVVEHLFAPHMLPTYAHQCLKPGGRLIISTPYHGYLKNVLIALAGKWDFHHTALWHGGHVKFWSRKTLSELLVSNGFEIESFHGAGRAPYLWKSMVIVARKT